MMDGMDAARPRTVQRHLLAVGDAVTLVARRGDVRVTETDNELQAGRFQVTRLLPQDGDGFQYRIKDLSTGRERVVVEAQIERFVP